MQESVLGSDLDADVSVSIVWIEILPTDSVDAARRMAGDIVHPRVRHYFDPRRMHLAGTALARGIINEGHGPAWDVYLFYDKEAHWGEEPPMPVEWCHQLSGGLRADPSRYAGGVVAEKLREAMLELTAQSAHTRR